MHASIFRSLLNLIKTLLVSHARGAYDMKWSALQQCQNITCRMWRCRRYFIKQKRKFQTTNGTIFVQVLFGQGIQLNIHWLDKARQSAMRKSKNESCFVNTNRNYRSHLFAKCD